jgi:hypothetical protein
MQALEKLTIAYLALQERAERLQADKDAMFFENQQLLAKYKKAAENNRFLQKERNKWFDAYNELNKSNEALIIEQAEQMRNLKECIEELEGQLVALTPKEQRIDEPQDGYEAEKRVCRAGFKASGDNLPETIQIKEECEGSAQDWEKARCVGGFGATGKKLHIGTPPNDADETPVILLRTLAGRSAGEWITEHITKMNGDTTFGTNSYPERAKQFTSLDEVDAFLGARYPRDLIQMSYHHPVTLQLVTPEQSAADEKPKLYSTIYDNPA